MEGQLWRIIQQHLDDYGVRSAEFARRIGTSPQTVNSWKKRGVHSLPAKRLLVGVSEVTRRPYDEVLDAVLHDIGYLPKEPSAAEEGEAAAPTRPVVASVDPGVEAPVPGRRRRKPKPSGPPGPRLVEAPPDR